MPSDPAMPRRNFAVCAIAIACGLVVMTVEGYAQRVDIGFAGFATVVFAGALWSSARMLSTRRLLATLGVAGSLGLLTQVVGTGMGAWQFPDPAGSHWFVFFALGVGSVFQLGLVRWLGPRIAIPRPAAIAIVIVVSAMLATSGPPTPAFVGYYGLLVLLAVVLVREAGGSTVVALVVIGATYGMVAEIVGAGAGLWAFEGRWPPLWLVAGSWPLEMLAHYGLSALLAREPLDGEAKAMKARAIG